MVTKRGLIKRSSIRDYNTRFTTKGLQAIRLQDNDHLAFVESTNGTRDVFLATANGKAIRYPEVTVRATGRITEGVQAMKLVEDDKIAQLITIDPAENPDIVVFTEMGYAKKSNASAYRCFSGRSAKGIATIDKVKVDRNGVVIGACATNDKDTLMILTSRGKVIQMPSVSIRSTGRIAMGVRAIQLDANDTVLSVANVACGVVTDDEDDSAE